MFDQITLAIGKLSDRDEQISTIIVGMGKVETNVSWLMKWFWVVITPMATALVIAVISLILIKR